jgi:rfaE bifunctional protein kinase chain/domain
VVGDFALDTYYDFEAETGAHSVETGLPVHYGRTIRTSPGGAGNVVANLAALGPRHLAAFGILGDDLFGRELVHRLTALGCATTGLVVQPQEWVSQTYVKPMLHRAEQNRLDFGEYNRPAPDSHDQLFARLAAALPELDVLLLNQQFAHPLLTPDVIARLNELLASAAPRLVIADCRDVAGHLRGAILKLNTGEAARLLGIPAFDSCATALCRQHLQELHARLGTPLLLTRGENGLLGICQGELVEVPGLLVLGETDPVGAGDTCLAAFAAALGAGATWPEAAELANLAAYITVQKLGQTGTASPAELRAAATGAESVYRPDLAADPRLARYHGESRLELITEAPPRPLAHVILDHDGTLSTLREGWEEVMFAVALEALAGEQLPTLPLVQLERLGAKVRRMIEQTTGVQTIQQMMHLADMVREEGLVPPARQLDAAGYKARYNQRLMATVNQRIAEFQAGEKEVSDFTLKGAVPLLRALAALPLRLYLASGTDQDDVRREAALLGYAECFNGGIHGSLGNELGDAKRKVVQRILAQAGSGAALLVVGDGPVELREGRRAGALCLGVASDEVRRYGLNPAKRKRLIRAGADLIVPDFAQYRTLLNYLGLPGPTA